MLVSKHLDSRIVNRALRVEPDLRILRTPVVQDAEVLPAKDAPRGLVPGRAGFAIRLAHRHENVVVRESDVGIDVSGIHVIRKPFTKEDAKVKVVRPTHTMEVELAEHEETGLLHRLRGVNAALLDSDRRERFVLQRRENA